MAVHFNSLDETNNKEQHQPEKPKSKPKPEQENEKEDDDDEEEEDYIDMELSTFTPPTHFFSLPTEFEFQMTSSTSRDRENSTTSPADELFYMGKLLPLHLPPRLQMFQTLNTTFTEVYSTPLGTTPFESCNISPTDSCQVSTELNPEEYFRHFVSPNEYSKGYNIINNLNNNNSNTKKSWAKKLKTKIKALFGKTELSFDKEVKKSCEKEGKIITHRRSFSGAFKRGNKIKVSSTCSSSSCSSTLNGKEIHALKRSSSANSEMESSLIQGAIAHCKKSQRTRKTLSEIGFNSFSSSRFAPNFDDQNRAMGLCRG